MAYATKADIEQTYPEITILVVDQQENLVQDAEDALNDAIAANQPQSIIDGLTAAYTDAQNTAQTNADAVIDQHLSFAKDEIDLYIKSRYPRTWATVPSTLKRLSVDIAVYKMPIEADWRTDEMEKRYKFAIETLEKIQNGMLDLHDGEMEALEEDEEIPINTGGMQIGTWARS